jgi:hypothetical protein
LGDGEKAMSVEELMKKTEESAKKKDSEKTHKKDSENIQQSADIDESETLLTKKEREAHADEVRNEGVKQTLQNKDDQLAG